MRLQCNSPDDVGTLPCPIGFFDGNRLRQQVLRAEGPIEIFLTLNLDEIPMTPDDIEIAIGVVFRLGVRPLVLSRIAHRVILHHGRLNLTVLKRSPNGLPCLRISPLHPVLYVPHIHGHHVDKVGGRTNRITPVRARIESHILQRDQIDIGPVFNDYFLLRLVLDEIAKFIRSGLKDGLRLCPVHPILIGTHNATYFRLLKRPDQGSEPGD